MDPIDRFICLLVQTYLYIPLVAVQVAATALVGRYVVEMMVPPMTPKEPEENQS
jgi:hypothetical protein